MNSPDSESVTDGVYRCNVCGREFDDRETLEQHVRDQGLLW